jgi:hypothetical protein
MRIYKPNVGDRVKLRLPEHYRELVQPSEHRVGTELSAALRTGEISEKEARRLRDETRKVMAEYRKTHDVPELWAWFEVLTVEDRSCRLRHILAALHAPRPLWEGPVPFDWIAPPIGWASTYTIYCNSDEQSSRVLQDWFSRGIHVWISHELSSAGRMAYTPMGEEGMPRSPHWQFGCKPVETVPPMLCEQIFSVVYLEEWMPDLPEEKNARRREVKRLREMPGVTLEFVRGWGNSRTAVCQRETVIHRATGLQ